MIAFNMMILKLAGNIGLAAYGVVANLALVMIAVFSGIEQGIQPLFSQFYGSGEWGKVLRVLRYAMITMVLIAAGIYAVIFLFAEPIADIFNNEQNPLLREIAAYGLRLYLQPALLPASIQFCPYFSHPRRMRFRPIYCLCCGDLLSSFPWYSSLLPFGESPEYGWLIRLLNSASPQSVCFCTAAMRSRPEGFMLHRKQLPMKPKTSVPPRR